MDPNQNISNVAAPSASTGGDVVFSNKPKDSKGMITALICMIVLAIGGIGFGVWAMMDGNQKIAKKDEQINVLNEELKKKQPSETIVDVEIDENNTSNTSNTSNVVNTAKYIYIGEWGLKIKIPDDLTVTGYTYKMGDGYSSVGVLGNSKDGQYFPDFANLEENATSLGIASRYPKGTELPLGSMPQLVFSDEKYDYYYAHPQDVQSVDEDEKAWEVKSVELVQQMLSEKNNYSAI